METQGQWCNRINEIEIKFVDNAGTALVLSEDKKEIDFLSNYLITLSTKLTNMQINSNSKRDK